MNRYDVYDDQGRFGEPIEEVDGQWCKAEDCATVESDCRWAMEFIAQLEDWTYYSERAVAWLDAHKEGH
jgi:hypothetical protein